jgi:hypothetical protein
MKTTLNYSAIIAALVSVGSFVSIALGHPAIAAIISDPNTAAQATSVVGGVAALISAFASPVHVGVDHVSPAVVSPVVK